MMNVTKRHRVLIAEPEHVLNLSLTAFLEENGFVVRSARKGSEVKQHLLTWKPDFILAAMMLPEMNGLELLKMLADRSELGEGKTRVLIMSSHNNQANVRACFGMGASEYMVQPIDHFDLLRRLIAHAAHKRSVDDAVALTTGPQTHPEKHESPRRILLLRVIDRLLVEVNRHGLLQERLFVFSRIIADALGAARCSITECELESRRAWVRASSDDALMSRLQIDLSNYPELIYAVTRRKALAMDNLAADPTLKKMALANKSIRFNSLIAAPILASGDDPPLNPADVWGVLHVRLPENHVDVTDDEIRLIQIAAQIAGFALSRARAAGTLNDAWAPNSRKSA